MTDFLQDLRETAESILDRFQVKYQAGEPVRTVIERWVNLQLKLIKPVGRTVHYSDRIVMESIPSSQQAAISTIQKAFEDGTDVNPYLSKRILSPNYTDALFSDWGIHHLHVNSTHEPSPSCFIQRSDNLLFVLVHPANVYFVEIRPHGEDYVFAQKSILETINRNWPKLLEPYRLKGVLGVSTHVNDPEMIQKMREAGVNVLHQIGDAVYAPMGGGLTTAATGAEVTTRTDQLYRMADTANEWLSVNGREVFDSFSKYGLEVPMQPKWKLVITDTGFCIIETTTGAVVPIGGA
jgi:hypothetical protein